MTQTYETPTITWPELWDEYGRASRYQTKVGLIHAARYAYVHEEGSRLPDIREAVRFLLLVGNEIGGWERDKKLRAEARKVLIRHFLSSVSGDTELATEANTVIAFFAKSPLHGEGIDPKDQERVDQFFRNCFASGTPAGEERVVCIYAMIFARSFVCLAQYRFLDAILPLFLFLRESFSFIEGDQPGDLLRWPRWNEKMRGSVPRAELARAAQDNKDVQEDVITISSVGAKALAQRAVEWKVDRSEQERSEARQAAHALLELLAYFVANTRLESGGTDY